LVELAAFDHFGSRWRDQLVGLDDGFTGRRILERIERHAATDLASERNFNALTLHDRRLGDTVIGAAILLTDHDVLSDVSKLTREVTRVSGLESRISQALTCTVGRA